MPGSPNNPRVVQQADMTDIQLQRFAEPSRTSVERVGAQVQPRPRLKENPIRPFGAPLRYPETDLRE